MGVWHGAGLRDYDDAVVYDVQRLSWAEAGDGEESFSGPGSLFSFPADCGDVYAAAAERAARWAPGVGMVDVWRDLGRGVDRDYVDCD